jgi:hypothetical protein
VALKCVGPDEDYLRFKNDPSYNIEFVGDHCAATSAALTHEARAVWCLNEDLFPEAALGAICCGRPVVVYPKASIKELIPTEVGWYVDKPLDVIFSEVEQGYLSVDKKLLRRIGLKYNERLFKNLIRSWAQIKIKISSPDESTLLTQDFSSH